MFPPRTGAEGDSLGPSAVSVLSLLVLCAPRASAVVMVTFARITFLCVLLPTCSGPLDLVTLLWACLLKITKGPPPPRGARVAAGGPPLGASLRPRSAAGGASPELALTSGWPRAAL